MSRTPSGTPVQSPTAPALFAGLVDDAAVFPPGNLPLDDAVREHRRHRRAPYAGLVGPLLTPPSSVARLVDLVREWGAPLAVNIVARPGADHREVVASVDMVRAEELLTLRGVECGWHLGWRDHHLCQAPVILEVPRGVEQRRALDDIAHSCPDCIGVIAKLRTGATPDWAWPTEEELATFITDCVGRGLGFKLTGGLHHAVRGDHGLSKEPQHGLLNVLLAVSLVRHGAGIDAVGPVLAERDPHLLADAVRALDDDAQHDIRRSVLSFGCCGVTDPIGELADLDLIDEELRP